jgi:cell filamentation protein, protein adenylyltransferase
MVNVKKAKKGNVTYYYLQHAIRKGPKVKTKQIYLGRKIPDDLERIKQNFLRKIYAEEWYVLFDQIKKRYSKENKQRPPSSREKEMKIFATRFTYNTQRIEGSKLTLRETINLLEKGLTPSKEKPEEDVLEARAHEKVFYQMLEYSDYKNKDLSLSLLLDWHYELFRETKPDIAGKIRTYQVGISGSKFKPPLPVEIYPMLQEFFRWYSKNKNKIHPVELAALVHLKFVTIHPFADGNGRISRLIMNFILHKKGYPMLDIKYERRNRYYTALERSQIKKTENTFVQWFMRRYLIAHDQYIERSNISFTMYGGKSVILK